MSRENLLPSQARHVQNAGLALTTRVGLLYTGAVDRERGDANMNIIEWCHRSSDCSVKGHTQVTTQN